LYWAVLEAEVRSRDYNLRLKELLAGAVDVREALLAVAEWTIRRREQDHVTTPLSLYCALERHELSHRFFGRFITEYFEVLANYLRQQMRAGVLRTTDPAMATRTFIGAVVYHSLVQELFGPVDATGSMDAHEVSSLIVSIWLDGMLAQPVKRPRRHAAKLKSSAVPRERASGKVSKQAITELQEPTQ
jgi:hypothetical protein